MTQRGKRAKSDNTMSYYGLSPHSKGERRLNERSTVGSFDQPNALLPTTRKVGHKHRQRIIIRPWTTNKLLMGTREVYRPCAVEIGSVVSRKIEILGG